MAHRRNLVYDQYTLFSTTINLNYAPRYKVEILCVCPDTLMGENSQ